MLKYTQTFTHTYVPAYMYVDHTCIHTFEWVHAHTYLHTCIMRIIHVYIGMSTNTTTHWPACISYMYTYICIGRHTDTRALVYVCHTCIHVHIHAPAYIYYTYHTRIHTCAYTRACIHILHTSHPYTYMCIHTCLHTYITQVLDIHRATLGETHLECASVLMDIGVALYRSELYKQALHKYDEAFKSQCFVSPPKYYEGSICSLVLSARAYTALLVLLVHGISPLSTVKAVYAP
jgi:hypothetical protein